MATLADLDGLDTTLTTRSELHLQRLSQWWGLLSDICFSDLLLFVQASSARKFVVAGQIRPSTAQTLYRDDFIGRIVDEVERPLVARAFRLGEVVEGEVPLPTDGARARVTCIPVRHDEQVVAVLTRESAPRDARTLGDLESNYLSVFNRLARMISDGRFPFRAEEIDPEDLPRIGDGAIVVGADAEIQYLSPNALSTLHRLGVSGDVDGRRLRDLGLEQTMIRNALRNMVPTSGEVVTGAGDSSLVIQLVAVPLVDRSAPTGALVLLRDVTELRRRDELLMSKDATIREIHHRVKNNLQTISALLRLQARRLENPEAKHVLEESVRRIQAISLVHETLSHEAGEDVELREVVGQLVRTVEEGLMSPDRPIAFGVDGDVGIVPAAVVTPLAVVLNEALQNVVDHAYPVGAPTDADGYVGRVAIVLDRDAESLTMTVADDGVGLPTGFDIDVWSGLGTSIMRTLVTTELDGRFAVADGDAGGTVVLVEVPIDSGAAK